MPLLRLHCAIGTFRITEVEERIFKGNYTIRCQVLEGRLFSEGLHVLGQPPGPGQMRQYLSAYFGDDLPEGAVDAVVSAGDGGIAAVRQRLERSYHQVGSCTLIIP